MLYLLFNEGYSASAGADLVRRGLTAEAIRLARILCTLMPDEPEALGLLALMLFHDARSAARVDGGGDLVVLAEQDRSLWDDAAIAEGRRRLEAAARLRRPGAFQLQAAIAECHVRGEGGTDWAEIADLYDVLFALAPSAVIALNRAVAVSLSEGPEAGLALIERIESDGDVARVPPAAGRTGGHAAPPGPAHRGGRGLPAGARPGRDRRRAPLPGAAPARGNRVVPGPFRSAALGVAIRQFELRGLTRTAAHVPLRSRGRDHAS